MNYVEHMKSLNADFFDEPASEADVERIENQINVRLPEEYRTLLLSVPRSHFPDCVHIECLEPTPFGTAHFHSMHSAADVENLLDSNITPRNMVTIATGNFAQYICLSVAGIDHGSVYALDGNYRVLWDDEEFETAFPDMDGSIRRYLDLRSRDELPEKPFAYSSIYFIADSFDKFLAGLSIESDDS